MTIDLRSDTVTRPTEAMMEAIRRAELGDDGREGDPTVRRLEALAAETVGKEAALFVVSGTMGNLGAPAKRICEHTDTVNFCVSKGLSAPIGSLLAGPKSFIDRARAFRRMVGGNLRQGGVAAAPGIVALEEMTTRLADDHRTAKAL